MKQVDKKCETCWHWNDGECWKSPRQFAGRDNAGNAVWVFPLAYRHEHCGEGKWVDRNRRVHGWVEVQGDGGF